MNDIEYLINHGFVAVSGHNAYQKDNLIIYKTGYEWSVKVKVQILKTQYITYSLPVGEHLNDQILNNTIKCLKKDIVDTLSALVEAAEKL